MADAAVNLLVENLLQLLSDNIELIRGVDDDFKNLLEEVQRLKAFFDDASKFHSDRSQWELLVQEIQKKVHKAEDVIDKFLVQSKLHQDENKVGRFFDVGHLATVNTLAAEIRGIHEKVKKLCEIHQQAFQLKPVLELPKKGHEVTQLEPPLEENEVVGFDQEAQEMIKRLCEGSAESVETIPVVGMPGLGKTTLARKIYNYSKLSYEFVRIFWVYVGQQYKTKDIFLNILKSFKTRMEEYLNEDVDTLAMLISDSMSSIGRCLIVLDDVWATEVIDEVKKVFPENNKGHRILMTTRDTYVATYANPYPYYLRFLNDEESFHLLEKMVFGKGSCPHELLRHAERIARSCGGVPLPILVLAGALRGLPNKNDWQRVERKVAKYLFTNDQESWLKFVQMCCNNLPQEVQTCFLYCGVFPRDFDIPSSKLIRLWIAEGLIKPQQTYTLEEIAELHLNNLVNRNLLILMQKRSDGQIKTCRLHDMLHKFCREEATKKLLFKEVCKTADNPIPSIQNQDTCRRLCIQPSILYDFLSTKPSAEHVRSFYCFSSKEKQIELSPNDIKLIHKAFPLIRVMDVESVKFLFSRDFNQLFHLRYIAISGNFKVLPPTFGNFWNLQTLILNTSTSESTLEVKVEIWNMLQLRHLHTNVPAKLPSPTTTTGKASSLQTLSMVAPESCKKDVLAKACNLKKLGIQGQMASFLETKGGISNLEELKCLEHLKLLNDALYMNKLLHLPSAFFRLVRTVKKLTLASTRFEWSEADRLGKLESLEVLKLKENAFVGDIWKPEAGGFSQLRVLWIERAELETWIASNLNFPILRHLVLVSCDKLNNVPLELADIPNLHEMKLEYTSNAVKSAKEIVKRKTSKNIKFKFSIFPPET